jgi:hypothetical protein
MSRFAVAVVVPLVLAVALIAPRGATAADDFSISGTGQGKETWVGGSDYALSGTWSSDQLFGPAGTYKGLLTLNGPHEDCLWYGSIYESNCPDPNHTNCERASGWLKFYGNRAFQAGSFSITLYVTTFLYPYAGGELSGFCTPSTPVTRFFNLNLGNSTGPSFTTGLGDVDLATGAIDGSSTITWGAWMDQFDFWIHGWINL